MAKTILSASVGAQRSGMQTHRSTTEATGGLNHHPGHLRKLGSRTASSRQRYQTPLPPESLLACTPLPHGPAVNMGTALTATIHAHTRVCVHVCLHVCLPGVGGQAATTAAHVRPIDRRGTDGYAGVGRRQDSIASSNTVAWPRLATLRQGRKRDGRKTIPRP